ncbi:MAG: GNAT family N-acetyltransferase [Phycisphaerales bacterium JB038]
MIMQIRRMTQDDIEAVDAIQRRAYGPELVEPIDVLASRVQVAPEFCFVAHRDAQVLGYVLAHPWTHDSSPGLGAVLDGLPEACNVVHLHDMAVDPQFGGSGVGRALLEALEKAVWDAGVEQLTLVAVQGASSFWEKMGFRARRAASGYGEDAVFMVRDKR